MTEKDDSRIKRALQALEKKPSASSVQMLATESGLSVSHFRRLFVAEVGHSPRVHLRAWRLRRVAELLSSSDLPIKRIVWEVGGGDISRFVRDFRKAFACTPVQYRRLHSSERNCAQQ